ncbi:hypothetical protein ACFWQ6_27190 [Streptomyces coelicoflavus]|uniref:hypothetical protein n=2 Tax=Streptomyces TaxID=1883 RepID=UPI001290F2F5|nr:MULTISPECIES: hypothetical protein [Streptomyces]KAF2775680.1 hypothetical protein STPH1_0337 [Streptomyces sp. OM5714]MCX5041117.1 hypothetical protein [Streptomyces coelicoflavus]MDI6516496.1 hypothetical protein [Streptomyces coelicoflavus]QFX79838.1 hypothetical protein GEV49_02040 [Streptomyces sp. SYP-A7193]
MFQDSPIYDRLVAERGDVPEQVRRDAERVNRELEVVMRPLRAPGHLPGAERQPSPGAGWQRTALLPGPRPR